MKTTLCSNLLFGVALLTSLRLAASPLPRSTPEAQGIDSLRILDLVNTLNEKIEGMHSLMIVRHGQVIAEGWWKPYNALHNHMLYSLSKSFTSSALGFAAAEGKVSIDDEVLQLFPEDAPINPSSNLKAMRVRDLLTMTTGHQDEPSSASDLVSPRYFLSNTVPHLPGTHFRYNTAATFMQSAIVQKVTGQTVLDYLRPRLFEPLGIDHPVWDTNFQGISMGGTGLRIRTEDIAKFGQLYLQKGMWYGKQLLAKAWVEMATTRQVSNGSNPKSDWNQGYGFQFWRCRNNSFRGDGAFGQYCVVIPEQEVVVAITSGVSDMQAVLNILWEKLLPACQPTFLPANEAQSQKLVETLGQLEIPAAKGAASSGSAHEFVTRNYRLEANDQKLESLSIETRNNPEELTLVLRREGQEVQFPAGFHVWKKGRATIPSGRTNSLPNEPVAGTYGWTSPDTIEIKICAYETPYILTYRLKFSGEQVTVDRGLNVSFGGREQPTLKGRLQ